MRLRIGGVVCVGMSLLCVSAAQSGQVSDWVGVWQAQLDGQPSAILTLATDTGSLEGTLVLNGISRDGGPPHIAVREAHVLMHTHVEGNTLSFQVKRGRGPGGPMNFAVVFGADGKGALHCLNCVEVAPVVEMTREGNGW